MRKLYFYDAGVIDYFAGMTIAKDYFRLYDVECECPFERSIMNPAEVEKFLLNSFFGLLCHDSLWEGEIRGDNVYISAIPSFNNIPFLITCFKQDNNGHTFIVSETPIITPDDNAFQEISEKRNMDYNNILSYQNIAFSLMIEIRARARQDFLIKKAESEKEQSTDTCSFDFEKIG